MRVYLDKPAFFEPKKSKMLNIIYTRIYMILVFFYLITIYYLYIRAGKIVLSLFYLIYGCVLIGVPIYYFIVQKKYGRLFIEITEELVALKDSYLEKKKMYRWNEVKELKFDGSDFYIRTDTDEKKFKAPLDIYLDLRKILKGIAVNYPVRIVE